MRSMRLSVSSAGISSDGPWSTKASPDPGPALEPGSGVGGVAGGDLASAARPVLLVVVVMVLLIGCLRLR